MGFLFAVENNRTVSIQKGQWTQVKELGILEDGVIVWLRIPATSQSSRYHC